MGDDAAMACSVLVKVGRDSEENVILNIAV